MVSDQSALEGLARIEDQRESFGAERPHDGANRNEAPAPMAKQPPGPMKGSGVSEIAPSNLPVPWLAKTPMLPAVLRALLSHARA